jgi:RHS repeat-associated protein
MDDYRMTIHRTWQAVLAAILVLIATTTPAAEKVTYYHLDALGSPLAATDFLGEVVWRETYQPYGARIQNAPAASDNARWYTGHVQDPDTGLVYAGARYYDPTIGRFLAVDPVAFTEKNVHSFNRYAYGNNNPYKYIDPDGMAGIEFMSGYQHCILEVGCLPAGGGGGPVGGGGAPSGVVQGAASKATTGSPSAVSRASQSGGGSTPQSDIIYRGGGSNPGNLKTRPGESAVSFRDSLSNPTGSRQNPVFKPGDQYIGVDTRKLPPGSVVRDNSPPGHVSVKAAPEQIKDAIVDKGKLPR